MMQFHEFMGFYLIIASIMLLGIGYYLPLLIPSVLAAEFVIFVILSYFYPIILNLKKIMEFS